MIVLFSLQASCRFMEELRPGATFGMHNAGTYIGVSKIDYTEIVVRLC